MADVLNVINTAYELYRKNWRSVVTAFAVIFIISFVFGIIDFIVQLSGSFLCDENSPIANNVVLVLLFCVSPAILQTITGVLESLISVVITMAVLKPLDEMATGRPISSWTQGFINSVSNALLVIILRAVLLVLCFTPLIIAIIPILPALAASKGNLAVLAGGGIVLLLTFLLGVLLSLVLSFLLTFLEVEIAVGGSGIFDAASKSARLAISNFFDVLLFFIVWFVIGIGVGLVTFILMCTVCLFPLAFVIPSFIAGPIMLLSTVILWRRLKGLG